MEFRVLGSLEVVDRGAVVSLGGAKQRALLAVLLLNANEVVSADELIDALWGERSLESGRSALHVRVSQLRKALGRAGAALLTRTPGYVLQLDREQLDLHRFERLVADAEAAEPATAAVKLREALALWRGRPLADLAYESFAQPAIGRMEELRFGAIEKRIDADLGLGRHAKLVPELGALVSEHPLRERLRAQLMLALYRCGRQAEALEVYQEFRRTLSEQLGLEPGPGLKALQTQLLEQASELDASAVRGEMEGQRLAGDLEMAQRIVARDRVETSQAQVPIEPPSWEVPIPLPLAASAPVRESSLADRAGELRLCAAAAERVCAGEQRLVLIAGEPGIGKTRLAAELAGKLYLAGMTVLWGRCDPELGVPYQPFVEILTHYTRFASQHVLVQHRAQYGNELARLVPGLAGTVSRPSPLAEQPREENRHVMFAAVEGLLRTAALHRPLVLVIDDLQWADKPTLLLLKYLLLSSQPMRVLLVGTYRSTERGEHDALDSLLADLRRQPGVEWLLLGGLPADDAIELAQSLAQERLEPAAAELVHGLWEQADGNPFLIGEIVRSLSETGGVNHAARAHAAGERSVLLPQSIRETIAVRVARLGERVEQVLSAAAVIGMEFDVELLATACDGSEEQLVEALDAAAVSALIAEVPGFGMRFAFVHQLTALALYEQLGAARRRSLHARVLQGLELLLSADQRSRRIGELAQHALRAVPMIAVGESVDYARLAGEHALAQLAPQEAMRWFDQALSSREHLDPQAACDGERLFCDLLIGRGIALEQGGDPESRSTLLQAAGVARRLGDSERLVRAVLANLRPITETGKVDRERIEMLEAALATVGDDSAPRARLLTALAAELTYAGDWERRKRLSDESLAIAERLSDPATLTAVINKRFLTIWTPETLQQRRANIELGLATAEALDDPLALFGAIHWKAAAAVEAGELHLASELVERQGELASRVRHPFYRWLAAYDRATQALIHGRLEEAEFSAEEARQVATETEQPDAIAFYAGQLINIRFEQGRLAELEPLIAQQVESNPGIPAFRGALVLARSEVGMCDQARDVLSHDAATNFSELPYDSNWLVGIVIHTQACATLDDKDAAAKLYRLLEPWRDQVAFNSATAWGTVERHLGNLDRVLGRYDEAEEKLVSAAARHEQMGAPIWLARTRLDLARVLLDRGRDRTRASELLRQSRGTARELGCASIKRQASALLDRLPDLA